MAISYAVARGGVGPDASEFFESFEKFVERVQGDGLEFDDPHSEETDVQIVQTWPIRGKNAGVKIFDNYIAGVRHIEFAAADERLLSELVDAAHATLPLENHEQLVQEWLAASVDDPSVVVKIALSAPGELSDAAFFAIADSLRDPSAAVRSMAAYAVGLNGAPRFEPALREQLEVERDTNTRDVLQRAVWMYENI